jgi:glycosyltransferase involved in cell wall biosynthesis
MCVTCRPRVTVAIPLYRSKTFLDVVTANLNELSDPDLEILISDRHLNDDAIDVLESRFGADSRIRFLRARDGIGWVGHFNELLRAARGEYFLWMPHDDTFPPDYLPRLVDALDRNRDAVLAFGRIDSAWHEPRGQPAPAHPDPPLDPGEPWTIRVVLRLTTEWNPGIAFRGLFRRQPLRDRGLFIRPTHRGINADRYWVSATGMLGRWVFVPECLCTKRYHEEGTHTRWELTGRHHLDAFRVLCSYVRDLVPNRRDRWRSYSAIARWQAQWHAERRRSNRDGDVRLRSSP